MRKDNITQRKGSIIDFFWVAIVLVVMAIMLFLAIYLKDQIFPSISSTIGAGVGTNTLNTVSAEFVMFDYIFLFAFVFFFIVPIILAFSAPNHPVFYVINILVLILFFAVIPVLSNVVREFVSNAEFSEYAAGGSAAQTYPIMTRLMQYLPQISIGAGIILIMAMFAKPREGSL